MPSPMDMTYLELVAERPSDKRRGLADQVLDLLAQGQVLKRTRLRDSLSVKNERLGEVLESLERAGGVVRTPGGWRCQR